jgi:nitroreductase
MDFNSVIEQRHSVRAYRAKAVGWRDVVDAVDAARKIPLAGNTNALKILVTFDPKKIAKTAEHAEQLWISDASMLAVVCSDESLLEKMYGERGRIYVRQQAGAAIQTFLLVLANKGIGGCWVGAFDDNKIRRLFEIPENIQIEALIPIGYEKTKPAGKKYKRALKGFMFWEKWNQKEIPSFFKEPEMRSERR